MTDSFPLPRPVARLLVLTTIIGLASLAAAAGPKRHTASSAALVEPSLHELRELVTQAAQREPLRMPTGEEIEVARAAVHRTRAHLLQQLAELPLGASITEELRLTQLAAELDSTHPNLEVLSDILRQVQRMPPLPDVPTVKPLRRSLLDYVSLCRVQQMVDPATSYEQTLDELASGLSSFAESEENLAQVAAAYGWLARHQQAPRTRALLLQRFGRPNVLIEVGPELLSLADTVNISRELEVAQTLEGFRTTGNGHVTGTVQLQFVPNRDQAQLRVYFQGDANCAVRSSRRNLSVWGQMKANFHGSQDFLITSRVESRQDVSADVSCSYRPHAAHVSARCQQLGHALEQTALRVARRKRPQIEQQSAREIRKYVAPEIQNIIDQQLTKANETVSRQLLDPLDAVDIQARLVTSTSDELLTLQGTIAARDQLAATHELVTSSSVSCAAQLRFHESLVNNLAVMIDGLKLDPEDLRMTLGDLLGMEVPTPESVRTTGYLQMIQFATERPFAVRLRDDAVQITIRLQAFGDGTRVVRQDHGWEVTAAYRLTTDQGQIVAQRIQPLHMSPSDGPDASVLASIMEGVLFESAQTSQYGALGQSLQRIGLQVSSISVNQQWGSLHLRRADSTSVAHRQ